ncbi:melanoma-associated antigen B1-like [Pontoporia blainvillei]|uniref:Melanoma-associated antigen B1-like n=1 Tax=Pontoporia blainvillei TaxID=48723 RepID=A0ABX0S4I8_PONBL|nr:melanoma-associated antigen B1-like [Pontoporia blainvillei]
MQEPIIKADLLKLVNKRYKAKFPEILRRAAECIQLVFGLELKEVKPGGDSYTLVSKLRVSDDGRQSSGGRFRKNGLLMLLLGVILLHGDSASEEEIWEFLNGLGVYGGRRHIIFGDPRKLITEDLVQEKYLVYRQVRDSDPPRCEFLWGPRAHAETSKMKVLEFVAKVIGTVPSALPDLYEEALKDEEERARARAAARAGTRVKASARSKVMSSSSSHP